MLEPLIDDLRLVTVAPELPGATDLIGWFRAQGVTVSLGHSAATCVRPSAGYAAGATLDHCTSSTPWAASITVLPVWPWPRSSMTTSPSS